MNIEILSNDDLRELRELYISARSLMIQHFNKYPSDKYYENWANYTNAISRIDRLLDARKSHTTQFFQDL